MNAPTDKKPAALILRDPARDPQDDELACAEAIRRVRWFDAIEKPEHWPVSTDDAAALLAAGGCFAVTATDLEYLVGCGLLPPPAAEDGVAEWSASDVIEAGRVLETRRAWQLDSPHAVKMLDQEKILHVAQANAEVGEIAAPLATGTDLLQTLMNMVYGESREVRLLNSVVFRLLLEHQHGIRL